jgi:hypothetical protein
MKKSKQGGNVLEYKEADLKFHGVIAKFIALDSLQPKLPNMIKFQLEDAMINS